MCRSTHTHYPDPEQRSSKHQFHSFCDDMIKPQIFCTQHHNLYKYIYLFNLILNTIFQSRTFKKAFRSIIPLSHPSQIFWFSLQFQDYLPLVLLLPHSRLLCFHHQVKVHLSFYDVLQ